MSWRASKTQDTSLSRALRKVCGSSEDAAEGKPRKSHDTSPVGECCALPPVRNIHCPLASRVRPLHRAPAVKACCRLSVVLTCDKCTCHMALHPMVGDVKSRVSAEES